MAKDLLSPFDILPKAIITSSILPFTSSDDWLTFRTASRSCYEVVHGTNDVSHSFCNLCQSNDNSKVSAGHEVCDSHESIDDSDRLWNLALIRDYRFRRSDVESKYIKQSIHSPVNENESFLTTKNIFTATTSFISWKHWRKVEARHNHPDSDDSTNSHQHSRCTNPCRQLVGPYYLRAALLWKKIEHWCDDETLSCGLGDEMRGSLVPGRNVLHLHGDNFQVHHVITALLAVYSFYSGQCQRHPRTSLDGLFGGYSAYNFGCMMRWCQWEKSVKYLDRDRNLLLIAFDSSFSLKCEVYLDMESGQLFTMNCAIIADERLPATPIAKESNTNSTDAGNDVATDIEICAEDSLLRWFEQLAERLTTRYYSVGRLIQSSRSLSILQFPSITELPIVSRAVTRGVEVVASSVYYPWFTSSGSPLFIYSIRLRLLTPEDGDEYESPEQRGFATCQLHSRHWIITKQIATTGGPDTTRVEEVRGEGVVGEYPLLIEGGYQNFSSDQRDIFETSGIESGTFRYQSCTDHLTKIFEGYLHFVPGSLKNPQGDPFRVRVAPFNLCSDPDYYY